MSVGPFQVFIVAGIIGLKISVVAAECCYPKFTPSMAYLNATLTEYGFCNFVQIPPQEVYVQGICNNGEIPKGMYCGHGNCNLFGCNCEGGCLEKNDNPHLESVNCTDINNYRLDYLYQYDTCTLVYRFIKVFYYKCDRYNVEHSDLPELIKAAELLESKSIDYIVEPENQTSPAM